MISYIPKWFTVKEIICPEIYSKFGERSLMFMDNRILWTIDSIREHFASKGFVGITINNWSNNGIRKYSGLRPFDCSEGAKYSQHKFGRAIDFLVNGITPSDVRKHIIENQKNQVFQYITRMEDFDGMSWTHIDCANEKNGDEIFVFNPKKS